MSNPVHQSLSQTPSTASTVNIEFNEPNHHEAKTQAPDKPKNFLKRHFRCFNFVPSTKKSSERTQQRKATRQQAEETLHRKAKLVEQLEDQYGATVAITHRKRSLDRGYSFKVKSEQLGQTYRFKSLEDAEAVLEKGYARNRAKLPALISSRVPRFRDIHNVNALGLREKGPVMVIDGGDDMAVALEKTGLPRKVVQIVQASVLYPVFIGLVHKGWEGAREERLESLEAIQQTPKLKDLKSTLQQLLQQEVISQQNVTKILQKSLDGTLSSKDQQAFEDHLAFQHETLKTIEEFLESTTKPSHPSKHSSIDDALQTLLANVKEQNTRFSQDVNHSQDVLSSSQGIRSNSQCIRLSNENCIKWLEQLAQYQDQKNQPILEKIAERLGPALTESGLGSMYWGMATFEARALTELVMGHSQSLISEFLSSMGAQINTLGQMQMTLAALCNTYLAAKEAQSIDQSISDLKAIKNQFQDKTTNDMLDRLINFKKSERLNQRLGATGNALLSAGQAAMATSYFTGNLPQTLAGVAATLVGVGTNLVNAQIWHVKGHIPEGPDQRMQQIMDHLKATSALSLGEVNNAIRELETLAQERTQPKIWLDLCLQAFKQPNEAFRTEGKLFNKLYQQLEDRYRDAQSGEHRYLYQQALNTHKSAFKEAFERFREARFDKGPLEAYVTLCSHYQSLTGFPNNNNEYPNQSIQALFNFTEMLGVDSVLEQRIVKKLVNREHLMGKYFSQGLQQRYLSHIPAQKAKKPWAIPNPLAPITNLVATTQRGQQWLDKLTPKVSWGHKETTLYTFNKERFLKDLTVLEQGNRSDLLELGLSESMIQEINRLKNSLFDSTTTSGIREAFGTDRRNQFNQTLVKAAKPNARAEVLRPIVHGQQQVIEYYQSQTESDQSQTESDQTRNNKAQVNPSKTPEKAKTFQQQITGETERSGLSQENTYLQENTDRTTQESSQLIREKNQILKNQYLSSASTPPTTVTGDLKLGSIDNPFRIPKQFLLDFGATIPGRLQRPADLISTNFLSTPDKLTLNADKIDAWLALQEVDKSKATLTELGKWLDRGVKLSGDQDLQDKVKGLAQHPESLTL